MTSDKVKEQIRIALGELGATWEDPELVEKNILSVFTQYHQRLVNKMEHYWHYAGEWHDAGCAFVCVDHGVCNCDTKTNQTIINNLSKLKYE